MPFISSFETAAQSASLTSHHAFGAITAPPTALTAINIKTSYTGNLHCVKFPSRQPQSKHANGVIDHSI